MTLNSTAAFSIRSLYIYTLIFTTKAGAPYSRPIRRAKIISKNNQQVCIVCIILRKNT